MLNANISKMKTSKPILKFFAVLISSLVLLQSCSVYHKSTCSVDEAIRNNSKVKISVENNDPYILKRLERHDSLVYGVANTNSSTYKRLRERVQDHNYEGKYALILLQDQDLKNIHEKNTGASTAISIGIPVVVLGIALGIAASTVSVSPGWDGGI